MRKMISRTDPVIRFDAMRNNSNKLVNQDMPILIVSVIWGINELMAWMNGK